MKTSQELIADGISLPILAHLCFHASSRSVSAEALPSARQDCCRVGNSAVQCSYCSYPDVRPWERDCPSCGRDCGYPNLRRASDPAEVLALERRFSAQQSEAKARGCARSFAEFVAIVGHSQAVTSRKDKVALRLLENDNELWRSFYDQVESGVRRPEDTLVEDMFNVVK